MAQYHPGMSVVHLCGQYLVTELIVDLSGSTGEA